VKQYDKSPLWLLMKKQTYSSVNKRNASSTTGAMGGRPCAVFEYAGPAMDRAEAEQLIGRTAKDE
jgi:hypothetical protein